MNRNELIKFKILHELKTFREQHGPTKAFNPCEISKELGATKSEIIDKFLPELQDMQLINCTAIGGGSVITSQGIALVDKNNPFLTSNKMTTNNISVGGDIVGSTIDQSNNKNTASITLTFLSQMEREIASSEMPPEDKKHWSKTFKELSSNPSLVAILTAAIGSL